MVGRYIKAPGVSENRLTLTPNGNVRYLLKTPYRENSPKALAALLGQALACIEDLAAIQKIPSPDLIHRAGTARRGCEEPYPNHYYWPDLNIDITRKSSGIRDDFRLNRSDARWIVRLELRSFEHCRFCKMYSLQ